MGFLTHKTAVPDDLLAHGIRGRATVENAQMATRMEYSGTMRQKKVEALFTGELTMNKFKLQLRVELPGRDAYLAKVTLPVPDPKIRYMTGGSVCEVLVDPRKPDRLAIDWNGEFQQGTIDEMASANPMIAAALKGAGVDVEAISQLQRNAMAQVRMPGGRVMGGGLTGGTPTASGPDPLDQIKRLADLRDAGILTDEEFATQKARLLNS